MIAVRKAVGILIQGGVVAYPTETFYALGVKYDLEASLSRLYDVKRRPPEKGTPLIIGERSALALLSTSVSRTAMSLMDKFWPGPLTLVVPALENISDYITSGTHTVAVRIPGESFALRLAASAGFAITATSANVSGEPPAEDAKTVKEYFDGVIDLIIDGGKTPGDLPSTIVDTTVEPAQILREGAVKKEALSAAGIYALSLK